MTAAPMPTAFWRRTSVPTVRASTFAPRASPPWVDHARLRSQKSSVITGPGPPACPRDVAHHVPMLRTSNGCTSMARPIFPPFSSG